jgi:hypothetical protein
VLKEPLRARELFEKIVLEYNSCLFVVDARKNYFALKEGYSIEDAFFNGITN